MITLKWPWPILWQGQIWLFGLFYSKKCKKWIFYEIIVASDLKVSTNRHLIEYMKICEYWGPRSFSDPGPRSCTYNNSNWIFSETNAPIWTKFYMRAFRYKEMKISSHDAGHMAKMAAAPIYGKNPWKIVFSRIGRLISTKLRM